MKLPTVATFDDIRIASPCREKWAGMQGDDRVRECGACRKRVYNLENLTREAAVAIIDAHEGDVCLRLYRRWDGTILTADCPRGLAEAARRARAIAWGAAALVVLGVGYLYDAATTCDRSWTHAKLEKAMAAMGVDHGGRDATGRQLKGNFQRESGD